MFPPPTATTRVPILPLVPQVSRVPKVPVVPRSASPQAEVQQLSRSKSPSRQTVSPRPASPEKSSVPLVKKGRGRPKTPKVEGAKTPSPRPRGRPPGSKKASPKSGAKTPRGRKVNEVPEGFRWSQKSAETALENGKFIFVGGNKRSYRTIAAATMLVVESFLAAGAPKCV